MAWLSAAKADAAAKPDADSGADEHGDADSFAVAGRPTGAPSGPAGFGSVLTGRDGLREFSTAGWSFVTSGWRGHDSGW